MSLTQLLSGGRRRRLAATGIGRATAPAHERDGLVVGDAVQPGPQRSVPPPAAQRDECSGPRRLDRVLSIAVVAQDRPAVAIERLMVTLVELGERQLVGVRHLVGESLVTPWTGPRGR
jgi:hypothetical protein